jgi:hypothetical protein
VRRIDGQVFASRGMFPSVPRALAWKAERMHFIFLDDAEVQIAVERCGRYWVPIVHFADAPTGRAIPTVF